MSKRMESLLNIKVHENEFLKRTIKVLEGFESHFKTLIEVATTKAQAKHNANNFAKVCHNIKSDLTNLDTCIK